MPTFEDKLLIKSGDLLPGLPTDELIAGDTYRLEGFAAHLSDHLTECLTLFRFEADNADPSQTVVRIERDALTSLSGAELVFKGQNDGCETCMYPSEGFVFDLPDETDGNTQRFVALKGMFSAVEVVPPEIAAA